MAHREISVLGNNIFNITHFTGFISSKLQTFIKISYSQNSNLVVINFIIICEKHELNTSVMHK